MNAQFIQLSAEEQLQFTRNGFVIAIGAVPDDARRALLVFYKRNAKRAKIASRWPAVKTTPTSRTDDELRALGPSCIQQDRFAYIYKRLDLVPLADDNDLKRILSYFTSKETLRTIQRISGRPTNCVRLVGITDYAVGDFLGPHRDSTHEGEAKKVLAFNLCLETTRTELGREGCLVYRGNETRGEIVIPPHEGSLTLFDVGEMGVHYVAPVSSPEMRRISLVGFFCHREAEVS